MTDCILRRGNFCAQWVGSIERLEASLGITAVPAAQRPLEGDLPHKVETGSLDLIDIEATAALAGLKAVWKDSDTPNGRGYWVIDIPDDWRSTAPAKRRSALTKADVELLDSYYLGGPGGLEVQVARPAGQVDLEGAA